MVTPATTASNVSPPDLRISIALAQARSPFALLMTIFFGSAAMVVCGAAAIAAVLNIQLRLLMDLGNCMASSTKIGDMRLRRAALTATFVFTFASTSLCLALQRKGKPPKPTPAVIEVLQVASVRSAGKV